MNANQLINMVIRQVMRRVINQGINAGMNKMSRSRPGKTDKASAERPDPPRLQPEQERRG